LGKGIGRTGWIGSENHCFRAEGKAGDQPKFKAVWKIADLRAFRDFQSAKPIRTVCFSAGVQGRYAFAGRGEKCCLS
jgi:hypothetical protein